MKRPNGIMLFFCVWLAILKVTVRYLLLVNSPVTSMVYFFYFLSNRAKHEGKSPTFLQFVWRTYNAAGGAPATICAFCVRVFCAPAVASATLVG